MEEHGAAGSEPADIAKQIEVWWTGEKNSDHGTWEEVKDSSGGTRPTTARSARCGGTGGRGGACTMGLEVAGLGDLCMQVSQIRRKSPTILTTGVRMLQSSRKNRCRFACGGWLIWRRKKRSASGRNSRRKDGGMVLPLLLSPLRARSCGSLRSSLRLRIKSRGSKKRKESFVPFVQEPKRLYLDSQTVSFKPHVQHKDASFNLEHGAVLTEEFAAAAGQQQRANGEIQFAIPDVMAKFDVEAKGSDGKTVEKKIVERAYTWDDAFVPGVGLLIRVPALMKQRVQWLKDVKKERLKTELLTKHIEAKENEVGLVSSWYSSRRDGATEDEQRQQRAQGGADAGQRADEGGMGRTRTSSQRYLFNGVDQRPGGSEREAQIGGRGGGQGVAQRGATLPGRGCQWNAAERSRTRTATRRSRTMP